MTGCNLVVSQHWGKIYTTLVFFRAAKPFYTVYNIFTVGEITSNVAYILKVHALFNPRFAGVNLFKNNLKPLTKN